MLRILLAGFFCFSIQAFAKPISPNDVVNPVDEENLGYLHLSVPELPAGGMYYDGALTEFRIAGLNSFVYPSVNADFRLLQGDYCLEMQSAYRFFDGVCQPFAVRTRSTVEYAMAAYRLLWNRGVFIVDFGPGALLSFDQVASVAAASGSLLGNTGFFAPWFAGTYHMAVKVGDEVIPGTSSRVDFADGEVVDQELQFEDQRSRLILETPERTFPTVRADYCQSRIPYKVSWSSGSAYLENPGGGTYFHFTKDASFELGGGSVPLTADFKQDKTIRIKRIDVNHVKVTREDGSTYMAEGTWWVSEILPGDVERNVSASYYIDCRTSWVSSEQMFRTGTGIDVLPGNYRVRVSYNTELGPREQQFDLNL